MYNLRLSFKTITNFEFVLHAQARAKERRAKTQLKLCMLEPARFVHYFVLHFRLRTNN